MHAGMSGTVVRLVILAKYQQAMALLLDGMITGWSVGGGGDDPCNCGIIITFSCGFLAIKVIKHSVCPLSKYTIIGYAHVPPSLPLSLPPHTLTHTRVTLTHSAIVFCPTTLLRSQWYVRTYVRSEMVLLAIV